MKIIRKLITGLLDLILIDLIVILVLNCSLKTFLIDDLLIESFKSDSTLIKGESNSKSTPFGIDSEVLEETLEDEEVKELLNDFIEDIINSMSEDESENIDIDELEKKVIEYTKNNKEEIKEKTGVEITDEMIDEASKKLNEGDLEKAINQELTNYKKNMSKEEKIALKFYNIVTSEKLRMIIIVSIIINILLIALIQWSIYKWIRNLSRTMIVSGLSLIILSLGIKYLISTLTLLVIIPKDILTIGIIIMVFGIIINIVYRLMTKYYIKENANEIS